MSTARVTVYSTEFCGYCRAAKSLLEREGVPFEDVDLTDDPHKLMALRERTGYTTVPMVFLDGELIGGYQELRALVAKQGASTLMPDEV